MSDDVEFPSGLIIKPPHDKAPDFVKGKLSINKESLTEWLATKEGEWVNMDIKVSKGGKLYLAVDNWKPSGSSGEPTDKPFNDDVPW